MSTAKTSLSGTWHNQHASEMDITISATGKVTGKYRTAVGVPQPSDTFELVGFSAGDLIAFTVDFGRYQSLTAWVGQHVMHDGVEKIETMWHLAVKIEDREESGWLWAGVRTGSDTFLRGPHPTGASATKTAPSHPLGRLTVQ